MRSNYAFMVCCPTNIKYRKISILPTFRFVNEYTPQMNLTLDLDSQFDFWKTSYDGSLAYYKDFCSDTDNTCVHSIQLHNRPEYAANINSINSWKIRSSLQWLRRDLDKMRNRTWPVLINLHDYEATNLRLKVEG